MKGFGIYVKNDLLDPKHYFAMGPSIWLYLWLLDRMTSVSEQGIGKVLGGKPITYEMLQEELGLSRITTRRWLERLRINGYIETTQAPYGLIIRVTKAKKIFGNRVLKNEQSYVQKRAVSGQKMSTLYTKNEHSNKDNTVDNTITKQGEPAVLGAGYAKAKKTADLIRAKM